MKKLILIFSFIVLLAGCYKTPNTDQLYSQFIVLTNYDSGINFKN